MPTLLNAKHERMAQALAEGKSQHASYIEAGYSPNGARGHAAELLDRNRAIRERRDEFLALRAEANLSRVHEIAVAAHSKRISRSWPNSATRHSWLASTARRSVQKSIVARLSDST